MNRTALLIAAHGERTADASNEGARQIARAILDAEIVDEAGVGFIAGKPGIAQALAGLQSRRVLVYPLFTSGGYFTRVRLPQLIEAGLDDDREVHILAPLGLDPGLPALLFEFAAATAGAQGVAIEATTIILLAHGSSRSPASRDATTWLAAEIARRCACRDVAVAFLEERPHLADAARLAPGGAIVVGLFTGEGLHGAGDAPRLVAALQRPDVIFAGNMMNAAGIGGLVARSVLAALTARGHLASTGRV